ncbi:RNA/RNP complex-1-interacting phosphatase [Ctenocephalides felis]|uniref:RNA/RNP complex-1-interacting phosphatase n=1 Tax=Ctenocephalides felis TaxID=7515 RepID=UPI000E6E39D5|nr:RNA/RNP complex-1-interacting phosphatase [Ctenocephalides felis]
MWMRKHPDVDLIIDLTNTHRYYNYQELISRGKQYKKIKTAGRIVPDPKIVQEFFDTVDDYIRNCGNSESFIGVHCTHGVNRTGFFICSYMIRRLGFHPQQAIRLFEEARGHKIERNNYIQALLEMTPEFHKPQEHIQNFF